MENPAYKLHAILNDAYSRCSGVSGGNIKFKTTWSKVFEIDEQDTSALLNSINTLLNLVIKTKEFIQNNAILNDELNNKFIRNIEHSLSELNFEGNMISFKNYINSETLTALNYIAKHMDLIYKFENQNVNEEDVKNLIKEIDELIESITQSSLQEEVKLLLFKNLNTIRESLFTYNINGAEGIKTALEQTIGSLFINNKSIVQVSNDENVKGLFNIIDKLNSILSTGVAIKDLLGPVFSLLIK
ncbi:hypothetical protein ACIQYL_10045 [Lysinibacillus xylanilyticus]|uniref:hypothetical protein n=1 Tax=Lysinibacillus xylanilyticus TaxID=582475 RepID=UPI00381C8F4D